MRRLLVFGILVLAACGPPPLKEGKVIDSSFTPAHDETYTYQQLVGEICSGGKYPTCTPIYMPVTRTDWIPDTWRIRLAGPPNDKGKRQKSWISVPRYQYDVCAPSDDTIYPHCWRSQVPYQAPDA